MRISSLILSHFRNYLALDARFDAGAVVLTGPNGAGKTNILEAVSLLAPGRGLRRARISELDRAGGVEPWAVYAEGAGLLGPVTIGTGREGMIRHPHAGGDSGQERQGRDMEETTLYAPQTRRLDPRLRGDDERGGEGEKRLIKIDGKPVKNQQELMRHVMLLWLTPQMDGVFIEGGGARRKLLDRVVSAFDPEHGGRLTGLETAVRERNRLLQGYSGRMSDPPPQPPPSRGEGVSRWLSALEQKIAEKSAEIEVARMNTVDRLNKTIMMSADPFPKAHVRLVSSAVQGMENGQSALQVEQSLMEDLSRARDRDQENGRTSSGAHVSEVTFTHVAKGVEAAQCSTGEQKALLLSLTLAQARMMNAWHGMPPILLLDEVVAHLDTVRRAALAEATRDLGAQVFLTGTDAADFADWRGQGEMWSVEEGRVAR